LDNSKYSFIAIDPYKPIDLSGYIEPVILLGHSWGCYQILAQAKNLQSKILKVVLVNPYLVVDSPLSPIAKALLGAPGVGNFILKKSHASGVGPFVEKMFSPLRVEQNPEARKSLARLQKDWKVWSQAAEAKIEQQLQPLSAKHACEISGIALWGVQDLVSKQEVQAKALMNFPEIKSVTLAGEGHAMIWTQVSEIIKAISN
jgi:olefin beta-lactone synthetase